MHNRIALSKRARASHTMHTLGKVDQFWQAFISACVCACLFEICRTVFLSPSLVFCFLLFTLLWLFVARAEFHSLSVLYNCVLFIFLQYSLTLYRSQLICTEWKKFDAEKKHKLIMALKKIPNELTQLNSIFNSKFVCYCWKKNQWEKAEY